MIYKISILFIARILDKTFWKTTVTRKRVQYVVSDWVLQFYMLSFPSWESSNSNFYSTFARFYRNQWSENLFPNELFIIALYMERLSLATEGWSDDYLNSILIQNITDNSLFSDFLPYSTPTRTVPVRVRREVAPGSRRIQTFPIIFENFGSRRTLVPVRPCKHGLLKEYTTSSKSHTYSHNRYSIWL